MAPEQLDGGEVSPQSDQYALALVTYEMLTGRLPWDVNVRDAKALREAHRHAAPTPPSQFCPWLPARMDAALLKALSKDPRARHDTLHGLMFELRGLQWIGDRPGMTGDANTTDPGALAQSGDVVRDEPDPIERMPRPPAKRPPLVAAGPADVSKRSVELSESSEPPTWPLPERTRPLTKQPPASAGGLPATHESSTTLVWLPALLVLQALLQRREERVGLGIQLREVISLRDQLGAYLLGSYRYSYTSPST